MSTNSLPPGASNWPYAWFRVAPLEHCAVVWAAGELDSETAAGLDEALQAASTYARNVVVDLSRVIFVDSTAMGVLLSARARINHACGSLALIRPPDLAHRLLASRLMHATFPVHATLGEGIDAFIHEKRPLECRD
jgi:anti-anti-sigma factor